MSIHLSNSGRKGYKANTVELTEREGEYGAREVERERDSQMRERERERERANPERLTRKN